MPAGGVPPPIMIEELENILYILYLYIYSYGILFIEELPLYLFHRTAMGQYIPPESGCSSMVGGISRWLAGMEDGLVVSPREIAGKGAPADN